jgi:hypothetical protein
MSTGNEKKNLKNPKKVLAHTQSGIRLVNNKFYDPNKCEICGEKHGFLQFRCKVVKEK